MSESARRFVAYSSETRAGGARLAVEAASFGEAALDFAEQSPCDAAECKVTVEACDTGERHCFTLHLGEVAEAPC
ncbi:MAG: hypothetical protein JOZ27_07855 [Caulobacteraceae bacterium]|nr:hypothetical protein [Caulobacteraceae bacterium]